jgi:hypothetical protein
VSGGWDSYIKFYMVQNGNLNQIGESYVGKPVHFMSGCFPLLVTAHSEKQCHIWNLEKIQNNEYNPYTVFESPLKY